MIIIRYIREAVRLAPVALESAQNYSDYQYALYCAQEELKDRQKEREQQDQQIKNEKAA